MGFSQVRCGFQGLLSPSVLDFRFELRVCVVPLVFGSTGHPTSLVTKPRSDHDNSHQELYNFVDSLTLF